MTDGPRHLAVDFAVGRHHDPARGQFLSVDPLVPQTQQGYRYVGEGPVNRLTSAKLGRIDRGNVRDSSPREASCMRPQWLRVQRP